MDKEIELNNNSEKPLDLILVRFGKYLLLDHLVDGGMAKICRARFLGEQADKIVAIKMIQAQYSQKPTFKQMFLDEIKVTFGLNHPNIASTYDYGLIDEQLFTAMEYVDGKNLKQYVDTLKAKKFVFPVEISTYIISQVCQALSYAHNFTDNLTGKKLNIIHRDISPHNIMLTYDGTVKVIDFGIAKAETNSEETQVGTIKGKISYLAPEYLDGIDLDHRYDQFAVGLTLWEMLCNRKLFTAPNELSVLKKIQTCEIPAPSSINPKVPKELDIIVQKCLSKNRNDRYENMEHFHRALTKFLYAKYPDFNATDLRYFAQELYKEEIQKDKERMVEFGKVDITPYLKELKSPEQIQVASTTQVTTPPIPVTPATPATSPKTVMTQIPVKKELNNESNSGLSIDYEYTKKLEKTIVDSHAKSKLSKSNTLQNKNIIKKEEDPENLKAHRNHKTVIEALFKNAFFLKYVTPVLILGILYIGRGLFFTSPIPEKQLKLIGADGGITSETTQTTAQATPKNINKVVDKEKQVRVNLIGVNAFQKLFLDNKPIALFNLTSIMVPFNKKVILRVEEEQKRPIFLPIVVQDENLLEVTIPALTPSPTGLLAPPADMPKDSLLSFTIDDQLVEYVFPIATQTLPIGAYKATLYHADKKITKDVEFVIEENKVTRLRFD